MVDEPIGQGAGTGAAELWKSSDGKPGFSHHRRYVRRIVTICRQGDKAGAIYKWLADSDVTREVVERRAKRLEAYAADPTLVPEHFGIERGIAEGGYGRRQIYELVQNGADAALDGGLSDARVSVVYTGDSLYCANQGEPITPRGVEAILGAYNSDKRNNQIGRFGVGFKCVLAVSSAPQFLVVRVLLLRSGTGQGRHQGCRRRGADSSLTHGIPA